MTGRLFFDTTVIVYGMDPAVPDKRARSAALLKAAFGQGRLVISPQILNEAYAVIVHRRRLVAPAAAAAYLATLAPACTAPLDAETHRAAVAIEARHRLSWWDCVALASALQARCDRFVSEDMRAGQAVEGLTIVDPFSPDIGAALALT